MNFVELKLNRVGSVSVTASVPIGLFTEQSEPVGMQGNLPIPIGSRTELMVVLQLPPGFLYELKLSAS
jgi:hypothetical protein